MRGTTILLAMGLTLGYGLAAHAAITADRAETVRRVMAPSPDARTDRVWYGGTLPPVVVEAPAAEPVATKCYVA